MKLGQLRTWKALANARLGDLEQERALLAELEGKTYAFIIDPPHRWSKWAAPKTKAGLFDHNNSLTGPDLIDYVDGKLFPYLRGFRERAERPDTIEYKLDPGRNLGKTNALNDADLEDFVRLQADFADSDNSWSVDAHAIDRATWDLSVKNPNKAEEAPLREPMEIMDEILALDAESAEILAGIRGLLQ